MTPDQLDRAALADMLNDARASLRFARQLARGANPAHYGCTRAEYETSAARTRAAVRALRRASLPAGHIHAAVLRGAV